MSTVAPVDDDYVHHDVAVVVNVVLQDVVVFERPEDDDEKFDYDGLNCNYVNDF